jgi:hypothetical protein
MMAAMQLLCPRTQFLLLNNLLQLVQRQVHYQKCELFVRRKKSMMQSKQTQLAALESMSMETLTDYRKSLLALKIAKLKAKVTLYIVKSSAQTDVVQTKKVRMNFELFSIRFAIFVWKAAGTLKVRNRYEILKLLDGFRVFKESTCLGSCTPELQPALAVAD